MSDERETNESSTEDNIENNIEGAEPFANSSLENTAEAAQENKSGAVKSVDVKTETTKNEGVKTRASKKNKDKGFSLKAWYKEILAEFNKIVWPNKKDLAKMTLTVVVVSLLFGGVIAGLDAAFGFGVGILKDLV